MDGVGFVIRLFGHVINDQALIVRIRGRLHGPALAAGSILLVGAKDSVQQAKLSGGIPGPQRSRLARDEKDPHPCWSWISSMWGETQAGTAHAKDARWAGSLAVEETTEEPLDEVTLVVGIEELEEAVVVVVVA